MNYSLEEIYAFVGKEDRVATVIFKHDSESYKLFGDSITVVFNYTQKERLELDELIKKMKFTKQGFIKATYLVGNLSDNKIELLKSIGINSKDISHILHFNNLKENTFHSTQTRKIKTLKIPLEIQNKGRDYDWIYGFIKRFVVENRGITPHEKYLFLAGKLYYEHNKLTDSEMSEIYNDENIMHEEIEYHLLSIKLMREEITKEETKKLGVLLNKKHRKAFEILDRHLQDVGSSVKKLYEENPDKAVELFAKVANFKDKRISHNTPKVIFIDINSYLHIYTRHVEEMKINNQFEHKDNFQWKEEDVFTVIEKVIEKADDDIQDFFTKNPNSRYSRYGDHSIYYEGDYYTFHIEKDGRISTFHKNKKK
ncbi:MAG: hypothetical protein AB7D46_01930 [Flavobacteriaceae bacterium]